MEELNNLIDFDSLKEPDTSEKWHDFCDSLKNTTFKGAYFIRQTNGKYAFGCTEEDKVGQERLLYKLKGIIEFYIQHYPDFYELKETAELVGKPVEELIDEHYEDVDEAEED